MNHNQNAGELPEEVIEWHNRYSDTDKPDHAGRWARIGYFRGLQIIWISRVVGKEGARFVATGRWPTNGNDAPEYRNIQTTFEESKRLSEKAFFKFRDHIAHSHPVHNAGDVEERMVDVLFRNKTDESDDGSWIESKDFYKIAEDCARICYDHSAALRAEVERVNVDVLRAVDVICNELRKDQSDGSYFYSWQANIAMSFYDEFKSFSGKRGRHEAVESIHHIANEAARRFLHSLCAMNNTSSPAPDGLKRDGE